MSTRLAVSAGTWNEMQVTSRAKAMTTGTFRRREASIGANADADRGKGQVPPGYRLFGSNASRNPSPSKLNDKTSRKIESPGHTAIHGALSM